MIRFSSVLHQVGRQLTGVFLLLFVFAGFTASASEHLHMVPLSLEERVKAADMILEGEVIAQRSFWDEGRRNIYTAHTIRVYKIFKGEAQLQEVELLTDGGTVGLDKHVFSAALQLLPGQQGVFFLLKEQQLRTSPTGSRFTGRAYGSKQGFIRYNLREHTAADVFNTYPAVQQVYSALTTATGSSFRAISQNLPLQESLAPASSRIQADVQAPVISSFSPTTASAGTGTLLTITGSGFGNTQGNGAVKFRDADAPGQAFLEPLAGDYKLWTDTRIQVLIPSYGTSGSPAGTGPVQVTAANGTTTTSSSILTITYATTNVVREGGNTPAAPILVDKNGTGGYTIRFAPSMVARPQAQEAFQRAMSSWICNTQVNWRVGASTAIAKAETDATNVILFTSIATNTLAQTISRYSGCVNNATNEVTWWLNEFDMEINTGINWQFNRGVTLSGNQFDFETVILHELGHAHQLGHVINTRANEFVMNRDIQARAINRTLGAADIEGANRVMQNSFNATRLAQMALCRNSPGPTSRNTDCTLLQASFNTDGDVVVTWTTNDETNITGFVIERSPDGLTWASIGTVAPKGPGSYAFTDTNPLPGSSFYRLRITYGNTTTPFYSAQARVIGPEVVQQFSVYPNPTDPTTQEVYLEYLVQQEATVTLQVYDYTGKLMKELEHTFTTDNLTFALPVYDLGAGMYIIRWSHGGTIGHAKLLKL